MSKELIKVPQGLDEVDMAIWLVRFADKAEAMTRELLWNIFTNKLYERSYSSWTEFVEHPDGLGKSRAWASQNLAIHKHYVIDGGLTVKRIEGIDTLRLYMATKLDKPLDQQLTCAEQWSRDDFKSEINEAKNCTEHTPVTICANCHTRI